MFRWQAIILETTEPYFERIRAAPNLNNVSVKSDGWVRTEYIVSVVFYMTFPYVPIYGITYGPRHFMTLLNFAWENLKGVSGDGIALSFTCVKKLS